MKSAMINRTLNNKYDFSQQLAAIIVGSAINFGLGILFLFPVKALFASINDDIKVYLVFILIDLTGWLIIAMLTGYITGRMANNGRILIGTLPNVSIILLSSTGSKISMIDTILNLSVFVPLIIVSGVFGARFGKKRNETLFDKKSTTVDYLSNRKIFLLMLIISSIILIYHFTEFIFFIPRSAYDKQYLYIDIILLTISLCYISLLATFFVWLYRSYRNLMILNDANLEISAAWAVGFFLVPIINFYKPYFVLQKLWKASNPDIDKHNAFAWKNSSSSTLIKWWWFLAIIYVFLFSMAFIKIFPEKILTLSLSVITLVKLICILLIVKEINERQNKKFARAILGYVGRE